MITETVLTELVILLLTLSIGRIGAVYLFCSFRAFGTACCVHDVFYMCFYTIIIQYYNSVAYYYYDARTHAYDNAYNIRGPPPNRLNSRDLCTTFVITIIIVIAKNVRGGQLSLSFFYFSFFFWSPRTRTHARNPCVLNTMTYRRVRRAPPPHTRGGKFLFLSDVYYSPLIVRRERANGETATACVGIYTI